MDKKTFESLRDKALKLLGQSQPRTVQKDQQDSLLAEHSVLHAELDVQNQELQNANLQLQHQLLEIETLFDSSPIAFCVLGQDKRIIRWNKPFQSMVHSYNSMTNKTFTSVYVAKGSSNAVYNWLMDDYNFNIDIQFHQDPAVWHRLIKSDFHSGQLLISIEDVTSQKVIEQAKDEKAQAVQKQLDMKADLLASMSHEIKTPLTSVMGFLDLLEDEELADTARNKVQRAKSASEGLLSILNEILDLSKLNAGHIVLKAKDIYLKQLVNECLEQNQNKRATDKDLKLLSEFEKGLPQFISADPVKLKQILNNLISNAIKFTEQGKIIVNVTSRLVDKEQMIEFNILDTGIGLDNVDIKTLFDEYHQADLIDEHTEEKLRQGSGLGLAICKKLANAMGGHIGAENRKEQGSRFWFRIPYAPALPRSGNLQLVSNAYDRLDELEQLNVLVAEDNRTNQIIMKDMLETLGQNVTVAGNGQEALSSYRHGDFDVIIMDTHMSMMSGEQVCDEIRQIERKHHKSHTPIISWSADARVENREHILNVGMDGLLSKPINREQLIAMLLVIKQDGKFFQQV